MTQVGGVQIPTPLPNMNTTIARLNHGNNLQAMQRELTGRKVCKLGSPTRSGRILDVRMREGSTSTYSATVKVAWCDGKISDERLYRLADLERLREHIYADLMKVDQALKKVS